MKVKLLSIIIYLIPLIANAQIADTQFGESQEDSRQKIVNRFGMPDGEDRESIYFFDKSYEGYNWGYITFDYNYDTKGESHLESISLNNDYKFYESAKKFLLTLKDNLNYDFKLQKNEGEIRLYYEYEDSLRDIELYIYPCQTAPYKYSVYLTYTDNNPKYEKENIYLPFPYAKFGDTYYDVDSHMRTIFGEPVSSDRENLFYTNINYASIKWDVSIFTFTYDSRTNYLSSIMFAKEFTNPDKAKIFRENLRRKLSRKYEIKYRIAENGFKEYLIQKDDCIINLNITKVEGKYGVILLYQSTTYMNSDKL